jgi:hypothetical protein
MTDKDTPIETYATTEPTKPIPLQDCPYIPAELPLYTAAPTLYPSQN